MSDRARAITTSIALQHALEKHGIMLGYGRPSPAGNDRTGRIVEVYFAINDSDTNIEKLVEVLERAEVK